MVKEVQSRDSPHAWVCAAQQGTASQDFLSNEKHIEMDCPSIMVLATATKSTDGALQTSHTENPDFGLEIEAADAPFENNTVPRDCTTSQLQTAELIPLHCDELQDLSQPTLSGENVLDDKGFILSSESTHQAIDELIVRDVDVAEVGNVMQESNTEQETDDMVVEDVDASEAKISTKQNDTTVDELNIDDMNDNSTSSDNTNSENMVDSDMNDDDTNGNDTAFNAQDGKSRPGQKALRHILYCAGITNYWSISVD
ncbi:hypothetical protein M406DRAFT_72654 [Cryphonectria parasitica EP155]|uniref:Uncharacterized protein n=1 Tax=Cryphonectria parasitica (strain ATCC 38755 / EP155) TaxID=660469 RepID=A0A9P4XXN5_CRYP1|nr:uncharacterized protein M406DRAFT_72654 [Cryphonectria parasitica EP155]KAF3762670.1 hypothetical protein M406DRAFT_72654 [Cryphonectria parasitica EP155]